MAKKAKDEKPLEMTGGEEEVKPRRFTNKKGYEVERLHPNRFQIQKIKLSKKMAVTLDYCERNSNGNWDKKRFTSAERPTPDFERTLQALATEIDGICGFQPGYSENMTIISVAYDGIGADKVMTAAIEAEKHLGADRTLKIKTPAISAPYEDADDDAVLSHGCVAKLDHMWNQGVKYLLGERSQIKLELDDDERELADEA